VFIISNADKPLRFVGERIRYLRESRGLSLSELARMARIAKSTLSAIESGRVSPTISTLWSIANALGVPFSSLVSEGVIIEEGGVSVRLVERVEGADVYVMRLRGGAVRSAEAHQEGVTEFVLVVSGCALVGPKDKPKYLRALDTHVFRGDVPHIYVAPEGDSLLVVVLKYGTRGKA